MELIRTSRVIYGRKDENGYEYIYIDIFIFKRFIKRHFYLVYVIGVGFFIRRFYVNIAHDITYLAYRSSFYFRAISRKSFETRSNPFALRISLLLRPSHFIHGASSLVVSRTPFGSSFFIFYTSSR